MLKIACLQLFPAVGGKHITGNGTITAALLSCFPIYYYDLPFKVM